ncbi:VOC family protein [Streptomyces kanamyceticus]|uniref:VOC family protein n=1 Tax=Streptomyces kanamyceticus TaxID=1967 RepID=UPI0037DD7FA1
MSAPSPGGSSPTYRRPEKNEVPLGEHRWLTVVSPDDPDGTELVLGPDEHPAVKPYKEALVKDGIPVTSFAVDDVHAECARLRGLGVRFTQEPADMGPVTTAVLDDTCGNLTASSGRKTTRRPPLKWCKVAACWIT